MSTENIVIVSDVIRSDIQKQYNRNEKMFTISPGVDTDYFTPAWVEDNRKKVRKRLGIENEKVVLFVGSEFKRKGLDHVLSGFQKGMLILVIGQGNELDTYKKMARKQGISSKVIFAGHSTDVRQYYAAADLVVLPSQSEAFGMSILEAMACGLPVVTTANTGVSSIIEQRKSGFVVDRGEDLRQFFHTFMEDDFKSDVRKKARETAMKYSWETITNQYEELFYEIVNQRERKISGEN